MEFDEVVEDSADYAPQGAGDIDADERVDESEGHILDCAACHEREFLQGAAGDLNLVPIPKRNDKDQESKELYGLQRVRGAEGELHPAPPSLPYLGSGEQRDIL